jgi:hypothetical protein
MRPFCNSLLIQGITKRQKNAPQGDLQNRFGTNGSTRLNPHFTYVLTPITADKSSTYKSRIVCQNDALKKRQIYANLLDKYVRIV